MITGLRWVKATTFSGTYSKRSPFCVNIRNVKFVGRNVRSKNSTYTILQENGAETNGTSKKS